MSIFSDPVLSAFDLKLFLLKSAVYDFTNGDWFRSLSTEGRKQSAKRMNILQFSSWSLKKFNKLTFSCEILQELHLSAF